MTALRGMVSAAAFACSLTACSGGGAANVDWENYAGDLQTRIDQAADQSNCDLLQREFDAADANNDRQRERVGDGNSDLMAYIDEQLEAAGCYSDG